MRSRIIISSGLCTFLRVFDACFQTAFQKRMQIGTQLAVSVTDHLTTCSRALCIIFKIFAGLKVRIVYVITNGVQRSFVFLFPMNFIYFLCSSSFGAFWELFTPGSVRITPLTMGVVENGSF